MTAAASSGRNRAVRFTVDECGATIETSKVRLAQAPSHGAFPGSSSSCNNKLHVSCHDGTFFCSPGNQRLGHLGTYLLVGDRKHRSVRRELSVGDIFRLGSVGFVVSEICWSETECQRMDLAELQRLRTGTYVAPAAMAPGGAAAAPQGTATAVVPRAPDESGSRSLGAVINEAEDSEDDVAPGGTDTEGDDESDSEDAATRAPPDAGAASSSVPARPRSSRRASSVSGPCCYICYEGHTEAAPLVAPCNCCGSTQYVHLPCLAKWNLNGAPQQQLFVRTHNLEGISSCTICKTPYKRSAETLTGESISLLRTWQLAAPSISLVVVTQHKQDPQLASTHYQLSFASLLHPLPAHGVAVGSITATRSLVIGCSSAQCDVPVKYRTISGRHACISLRNGRFHLEDLRSSNGTLLFMQAPAELPFNMPVRIKLGRTIFTLRAKRVHALIRVLQRFAMRAFMFGRRGRVVSRSAVAPCDRDAGGAGADAYQPMPA